MQKAINIANTEINVSMDQQSSVYDSIQFHKK